MPTRDERLDLQQYDNGYPGATVYKTTGSSGTNKTIRYHDCADCAAESKDLDTEGLEKASDHDQIRPKTRGFLLRGTEAPCKDCIIARCTVCSSWFDRKDVTHHRHDADANPTRCPAHQTFSRCNRCDQDYDTSGTDDDTEICNNCRQTAGVQQELV